MHRFLPLGEHGIYAMKGSAKGTQHQARQVFDDPSISRAALEAELTRRASAIRAAMEKLPLVEGTDSDELDKEARFVTVWSSLTFGLDLPRGRKVSPTVAQTELRTLINLMDKLRNHILRMHNASLDAIAAVVDEAVTSKPPPDKMPIAHLPWRWAAPTPDDVRLDEIWVALQMGPLPHDLADLLKICADIYRRAKIKPDKTRTKGPPGKNQARRTAEAAALAFWRLTGKRPTVTTNPVTNKRGGLFLKFLREVFEVIGLEASADVQALSVARQLKRQKDPFSCTFRRA